MQNVLFRLIYDESASTAIEYALIASGIALAIIAAINALGDSLIARFEDIAAKLA